MFVHFIVKACSLLKETRAKNLMIQKQPFAKLYKIGFLQNFGNFRKAPTPEPIFHEVSIWWSLFIEKKTDIFLQILRSFQVHLFYKTPPGHCFWLWKSSGMPRYYNIISKMISTEAKSQKFGKKAYVAEIHCIWTIVFAAHSNFVYWLWNLWFSQFKLYIRHSNKLFTYSD